MEKPWFPGLGFSLNQSTYYIVLYSHYEAHEYYESPPRSIQEFSGAHFQEHLADLATSASSLLGGELPTNRGCGLVHPSYKWINPTKIPLG